MGNKNNSRKVKVMPGLIIPAVVFCIIPVCRVRVHCHRQGGLRFALEPYGNYPKIEGDIRYDLAGLQGQGGKRQRVVVRCQKIAGKDPVFIAVSLIKNTVR